MPQTSDDNEWRVLVAREIGLRLQRRRLALGFSQERVAHLAGLSTYTYRKFEHGESKPGTPLNPTLFTLYALADVLEVEVGELVERKIMTDRQTVRCVADGSGRQAD